MNLPPNKYHEFFAHSIKKYPAVKIAAARYMAGFLPNLPIVYPPDKPAKIKFDNDHLVFCIN